MSYIRRASSSFTVHNGSVHRHRLLCAFRVNVSWRSTRRTLLPASTRGCQTWCPSRGEWNLSVHRASAVLLRGQIFEKIKLMSNVCKRSVRYKCKWKQVGDSGCVLQADPDRPVLAAGDPERTNMKKCDEMGGIPYHINVVKYMVRPVKRYEIQVVQLKCQSKNWFILDYFSTQAWECRQPFYLSLSTAANVHFSPSINSYFMVNFSQFEWTWPHFFFCFFFTFCFCRMNVRKKLASVPCCHVTISSPIRRSIWGCKRWKLWNFCSHWSSKFHRLGLQLFFTLSIPVTRQSHFIHFNHNCQANSIFLTF